MREMDTDTLVERAPRELRVVVGDGQRVGPGARVPA